MASIKIALAQMNSQDNWRVNLVTVGDYVRRASQKGAKAILFPENTLYVGNPGRLYRIAGELKKGLAISAIQNMARIYKLAILVGSFPEQKPGTRLVYNTSLWIDEQGTPLSRYRKMHLFDVQTPKGIRYRESDHVSPGDSLASFSWKGIQIGLSICYDLRFPEMYRKLSALGAQWLIIPSAFTEETGRAHWHKLLAARAIENLATVIAPAQTGRSPMNRKTFGHSLVVNPWGKVVREAGNKPGLSFLSISNLEGARLRKRFPVLLKGRNVRNA